MGFLMNMVGELGIFFIGIIRNSPEKKDFRFAFATTRIRRHATRENRSSKGTRILEQDVPEMRSSDHACRDQTRELGRN